MGARSLVRDRAVIRDKTFVASNDPHDNFVAEERTRRANRRRLIVFGAVFVIVAAIGLVYDFSRPAVYEATARLSLAPPTGQRATDAAQAGAQATFLRDEVQFLTSRTLLATVWKGLQGAPVPTPPISISDPAASLQTMLTADAVEGTSIVVLRASGGTRAFLKPFLDRLVAAYQVSLVERYQGTATDAIAQSRDEAHKLAENVVARRKEADAFRARYNIVSLERDENQVLAEVKGNAAALNAANDKLVAAEARLGALQEAQNAGQSVTRNRDNPSLAALEQQAVGIRADLREIGRTFTPQYMQIDPRVKAMRERLAELEQQIVAQRQSSQQGALQEARQEVSTARAAAARLRQQLGTNQQAVQSFTSRFNEYKSMQEEITRVEQLRQKAVERQAALEAEEKARVPKAEVLEPASTPTSPASPPYARDAAFALLAALVAGLLAMGIVELFNRPPPQPAAVVMPQTWVPIAVNGRSMQALGAEPPAPMLDASPSPARPAAALSSPVVSPRELSHRELRLLIDASDPKLRAAIALLSMGLAPHEVAALRRADVDREAAVVHVTGDAARRLRMPPQVAALLPADGPPADASLLTGRNGAPLSEASLDAALLYAAHDADLERAEEIDAMAVRHTYVCHLVRQGVRFSDLAQLVGDLRADALAAYGRMTPAGPRKTLDGIDPVLPAIRAMSVG